LLIDRITRRWVFPRSSKKCAASRTFNAVGCDQHVAFCVGEGRSVSGLEVDRNSFRVYVVGGKSVVEVGNFVWDTSNEEVEEVRAVYEGE
jgi:hypothetical protein